MLRTEITRLKFVILRAKERDKRSAGGHQEGQKKQNGANHVYIETYNEVHAKGVSYDLKLAYA